MVFLFIWKERRRRSNLQKDMLRKPADRVGRKTGERPYFFETETTLSAVGKFLESGNVTLPVAAHSVPRRTTS